MQVVRDTAGIKATIEERKFLLIYAMPIQIEVPEPEMNALKKEAAFWKRSDVVRIGSKSHVCAYTQGGNRHVSHRSDPPPTHSSDTELGLSVDVSFANQFVQGEKIVSKSESFRHFTAGLLAMLQREFVCWRGRDCFDNPDVNVRIFGDRFRTKAAAKRNA